METDVLGAPYERHAHRLDPDDEGEVVATLVRRRADGPPSRAVLYVHGFVDYFFQTHLADFYVERGCDFYALDLRKYGRSLLPHQTPNFARDMTDYYPELDDGGAPHPRGGRARHAAPQRPLHRRPDRRAVGATAGTPGPVQGLFLNSPFFEFNVPWPVRRRGSPRGRPARRGCRPYAKMPAGLGTVYGRSIHRDHEGEWDYDLAWKPLDGFPVTAGWVGAIRAAHRRVQAGLAHRRAGPGGLSARSYRGRSFAEAARSADAVLNVDAHRPVGPGLGPAGHASPASRAACTTSRCRRRRPQAALR